MALIVTMMSGGRDKISDLADPAASMGWPADPWREMAQLEYEYAGH
jgi:hypothetical protein